MATNHNAAGRALDRAFRVLGRVPRRWWAALLVGIILLALLIGGVAALLRTPPQPGAALTVIAVIAAILLALGLFVAFRWYLGHPRIYWALPSETRATFADYKGAPDVLDAARRIVALMRGVRFFEEMSGDISRGLLLVGPPGSGKSYLAQIISAEAGVPFAYASAVSLRGMPTGMDALVIRSLYRKARRLAHAHGGCVIFMDELDVLGMARGSGPLNELLMQMDPPPISETWWRKALRDAGFARGRAQLEPVLTIGGASGPDALDPALLHPGRFDRKIMIVPPTDAHRGEVIEYYLARVRHDEIPLARLVSDMAGYTPAAIKRLINEAAVIAHFDGRDSVSFHDIAAARETHEYGARYPRTLSHLEKRRLAYHEAGHVIAQVSLLPRFRVARATIVKRLDSSSEAFVEAQPLEEIVTQSAEEVFARIQVSLASRAAEELFLQTRLNSAGGDLANATQLALSYVAHWGMDGAFFSAAATIAPERMYTDPALREQTEKLLQQAYAGVRALLERRREALIAIAEALLERDELDSDEIERIIHEAGTPSQQQGAAQSTVAASALAQIPSFAPPSLHGAPATPPPATVDAIPTPAAEPAARVANGHAPAETAPAPDAFTPFSASPSQTLRADRVVDRALLRAPKVTRPIPDATGEE